MDLKHHKKKKVRAQELCEVGGGLGSHSLSHSFPVPSHTVTESVDAKHYVKKRFRAQELCEQGSGPRLLIPYPTLPPSLAIRTQSTKKRKHSELRTSLSDFYPVPSKSYGFCGRKAP